MKNSFFKRAPFQLSDKLDQCKQNKKTTKAKQKGPTFIQKCSVMTFIGYREYIYKNDWLMDPWCILSKQWTGSDNSTCHMAGAVWGVVRFHTVCYLWKNNSLSLGFCFVCKIKGMDSIVSSKKRLIRVFEIIFYCDMKFLSFLVMSVTIITRGESVQKAQSDSLFFEMRL